MIKHILKDFYMGGGTTCYYFELNKKVVVFIKEGRTDIYWFRCKTADTTSEFERIMDEDDYDNDPFMPENQCYDIEKFNDDEKIAIYLVYDLLRKVDE